MADESKLDQKVAQQETAYTVERIVAEAGDFLDVPSHVAAGALSGLGKKTVTLDEAKKAVKDYEKRPVEEDNAPATREGEED